MEDLDAVEQLYNTSALYFSLIFGSYLYEVWALALAMNNSLPVLENKNFSIDNYTIGQHDITTVIEEQMASLNFQGAGGLVVFNKYRATAVEIFWMSSNGTEKFVGIYNPMDSSDFHVHIYKFQ